PRCNRLTRAGSVSDGKIRTKRCVSLSHAGMIRIRSQGLLSARRHPGTPSDSTELYVPRSALTMPEPVSVWRSPGTLKARGKPKLPLADHSQSGYTVD